MPAVVSCCTWVITGLRQGKADSSEGGNHIVQEGCVGRAWATLTILALPSRVEGI